MRLAAILVPSIVFLGVGCAKHPSGSLTKLRQQIEELAQDQAQNKKLIEELNNRLFLLEDKVDTSRVAIERKGAPPRLPVIRLLPGQGPPDSGEQEGEEGSEDVDEMENGRAPKEGDGTASPSALVEDQSVSYGGEATRQGPRPVLRLHEGPGESSGSSRLSLKGPDPSSVTEKLDVVPLPDRKTAMKKRSSSSVKPMKDYQSALSMYRSGKFGAAADAFRSFIGRHTRHAYADNALYWLGECFYDMKNFKVALKMFRRVVEEYPTGNKAPDALLKMAYCYLKMEETANARTVLAQLMESFPKSRVAHLASETLDRIQ